MILECRDVTKDIRDNPVLRGISLGIEAGEFISIVGVSGSGKSTLMYILGLLDVPSTGTVLMDGSEVDFTDKVFLSEMRNKKIGFVFQFHYLISELTAIENIMVPLYKNGGATEADKEKCIGLLSDLGLGGKEGRKPYQLSGGEQQRVAIARALSNDPSIIMADEPTGNLDSKNSELVMDIFLELNKMGRSVLMITHEHELAQKAQKTVVIKDGLIDSGI